MKILVTGSSGFIGKNLLKRIKSSYEIVEYDLVNGLDILDKKQLRKKAEGCDMVIHLAALCVVSDSINRPAEYIRNNVVGTANVLDLGLETILASSWVATNPCNPYALSKKACEYLARNACILRFFNVYGRDMNPNYGRVTQNFIDGVKAGKLTIYGNGKQTRDFIHVEDVCRAIHLAIESYQTGIFDVGSGELTTINKLKDVIFDLLGECEVNYLPARDEPVKGIYADINKTYETFGWKPHIELATGLRELL